MLKAHNKNGKFVILLVFWVISFFFSYKRMKKKCDIQIRFFKVLTSFEKVRKSTR